MPFLKIQTNKNIESDKQKEILKILSGEISYALGKPEKYMMTAFDTRKEMTFAGTDEPTVYFQIKSVGLKEEEAPSLSKLLCEKSVNLMNIPPERVYIEFVNANGKMWGWNNGTF